MIYIKKLHLIQPEEGCKIHLKKDYGFRTEDNKYIPPVLLDEIYLAINLSKEKAFELYEDVELDKLDEYKKEWKAKIREQEELKKQQQEEVQEPELEDFDEEDE